MFYTWTSHNIEKTTSRRLLKTGKWPNMKRVACHIITCTCHIIVYTHITRARANTYVRRPSLTVYVEFYALTPPPPPPSLRPVTRALGSLSRPRLTRRPRKRPTARKRPRTLRCSFSSSLWRCVKIGLHRICLRLCACEYVHLGPPQEEERHVTSSYVHVTSSYDSLALCRHASYMSTFVHVRCNVYVCVCSCMCVRVCA